MRTWANRFKRTRVDLPTMLGWLLADWFYRDGRLLRIKDNSKPTVGNAHGYLTICVRGFKILEHHAIWLFHNGDLPEGFVIDHWDKDPTNNRIENLRLCTQAENAKNRTKNKRATSKYKGVRWSKREGKWAAEIAVDSQTIWLGYFTEEVAAARAYNEAATVHHKEFATLNDLGDV